LPAAAQRTRAAYTKRRRQVLCRRRREYDKNPCALNDSTVRVMMALMSPNARSPRSADVGVAAAMPRAKTRTHATPKQRKQQLRSQCRAAEA
jgi:hypothetical protein